jgi:hypothetical protein
MAGWQTAKLHSQEWLCHEGPAEASVCFSNNRQTFERFKAGGGIPRAAVFLQYADYEAVRIHAMRWPLGHCLQLT